MEEKGHSQILTDLSQVSINPLMVLASYCSNNTNPPPLTYYCSCRFKIKKDYQLRWV
jgi:hypothetical protein